MSFPYSDEAPIPTILKGEELLSKLIRVTKCSGKRKAEEGGITFKKSNEGRFQKGGTSAGQAAFMLPFNSQRLFYLFCTDPSFWHKFSSLPWGSTPSASPSW